MLFKQSIVVSAAAMETGLPPKVEACAPGGQFISSAVRWWRTGMPLAMPLAECDMSGNTLKCSDANMRPVRPMPLWTSS